MAKTQNKELAKFITKQFNSIMKETELDYELFASYAKIGRGSFRSYHSGTIPISVETLYKICEAYDIVLSDFLNSNKQLSIKDHVKNQTHIFKHHYLAEKQESIQEKQIEFSEKPVGSGNKWEREMIKYIILHTDYFKTARSIAEMVIDFEKEFELTLESGRIYELLRKYVGNKLVREESVHIKSDNTISNKTIFRYRKA